MTVCFAIVMSAAVLLVSVSAQNFGFGSLDQFAGDFGGPTAFAGSSNFAPAAGVRDPRQNRGTGITHFFIFYFHLTISPSLSI